jgi:hypothetical protein
LEFSHTVSPLLFAATTRYLAIPEDPPFRTLLHMRRPNLNISRLLGVSYIVSDALQAVPGTSDIAALSMPKGLPALRLEAVPDPNLGVSPTETIRIESDDDALGQLGRPDFNFEQQVILSGPAPENLAPAHDIRINIVRGRIRLTAHGAGKSLVLALPFRCLEPRRQCATVTRRRFAHCDNVRERPRHYNNVPNPVLCGGLLLAAEPRRRSTFVAPRITTSCRTSLDGVGAVALTARGFSGRRGPPAKFAAAGRLH